MLVDKVFQLIRQWAENLGIIAFFFLLSDAAGLLWWHDRPGRRLALVFGLAFIGALLGLLRPRPVRATDDSSS